MAYDGRMNIVEIDDETHTVIFDLYRRKKISGTKLGPILGMSEMATPFKVACELAGIYPGDKTNKYMEAGNILEPKIRNYVRKHANEMLPALLGVPEGTQFVVEEPVEKEKCGYDHFHDNRMFGGLVDGYIAYGGKRMAILEIKTSGDREKWKDGDGRISVVPDTYIMQAGLYAQLSNLDAIIFAVGFLEEEDYDRPAFWVPTAENTFLIKMDRPDMTKPMADAEKWYHDYIDAGETPEWTDKDLEIVKYLKAYKPENGKRR